MPLIDSTMKRKLQERHVGYLHANNFRLPDNCVFEPPCSIKWMQIDHSLSIGAFSYAVSGYYFGARIGRYTSIGEVVQVGRHNHPTNWSTTSPLFYRDYQAVLDFPVPEADGVHPNDFMLGAPNQKVHTTTIGNDVWIGHGAFISPGVVIGDGAVIGAYSVVTKDVPPYAVVAGAPAVVRKMRFSEDTIERMLKLRWWRFAFWDLKGASTTDPARFIESIEEKIAADLLKPYEPEKFSISELSDAGD